MLGEPAAISMERSIYSNSDAYASWATLVFVMDSILSYSYYLALVFFIVKRCHL